MVVYKALNTVIERSVADFGDGVGDGDARQAAATIERLVADGGDGARDDDARQASATAERSVADFGDGVGDGDARQAAAAGESPFADGRDGVGDDSVLATANQCVCSGLDYCVTVFARVIDRVATLHFYARQAVAPRERTAAD